MANHLACFRRLTRHQKSVKRKGVLFPFVGVLVGGSYRSGAMVACALARDPEYDVRVLLPGFGPNHAIFAERGLRVSMYRLPRWLNRHIESSFRSPLKFIGRPFAAAWIALSALFWLLRLRPSVVHVNDDRTLLTWGLIARLLNMRVVWHVRQLNCTRHDRVMCWIASDRILIANGVRKRFPESERQTFPVLHNAVDIPDITALERKETRLRVRSAMGIPEAASVVGFVGNLKDPKRPQWVVRAVIELLASGNPCYCVVAGSDHQAGLTKALQDEVNESVSERNREFFKFVGHVDRPQDFMMAVDVLGVPSIEEPFGLVVLEAAVAGAPVVACRSGGIPEIIEHGVNGLLVEPNDFEGFRESVLALLLSEEDRLTLAHNARRRLAERFSFERLSVDVRSFYRKMVLT